MRQAVRAMYVCICNGHRDSDIRAAAREGLRSAPAIYRRLGKPVRCGRCLEFAAKVIEEAHGAREGEREVPQVA
ncbi:MAG: (2Fe-2S)-binding protein [Gammaproteobacteria bacterium]|nr:hypothetical protein [Gammaproteobacteria bacterium]